MFVSEIYEVQDCMKYSADGSTLDGTFTTASDGTYSYITNCQADTGLSSFTPTGDFELSYKYYAPASWSSTYPNTLWSIGVDSNNGVLIGCEATEKRIRIYNRSGGSNTSQQVLTNSFSYDTWTDVVITYINGVWSVSIGANTITYSKTFNPSFIHLNGASGVARITKFKIKPL